MKLKNNKVYHEIEDLVLYDFSKDKHEAIIKHLLINKKYIEREDIKIPFLFSNLYTFFHEKEKKVAITRDLNLHVLPMKKEIK